MAEEPQALHEWPIQAWLLCLVAEARRGEHLVSNVQEEGLHRARPRVGNLELRVARPDVGLACPCKPLHPLLAGIVGVVALAQRKTDVELVLEVVLCNLAQVQLALPNVRLL